MLVNMIRPFSLRSVYRLVSLWLCVVLGVVACQFLPATSIDPVGEVETAVVEQPARFYEGKTLRLIVPFSPGGGTDTWARTLAPFLQKHLGHNIRVEVVNKAGASGVSGTNGFVSTHNPETILVSSGSVYFPYLLGDSSVNYDFNELVPILGSSVGGVVFVSPETGITQIEDLCDYQETLQYGGVSATGSDIVPLLSFELLGLDVTGQFGYDGKGAARVAFEQGVNNIDYQTTPAYLANVERLTSSNLAVPLYSLGIQNSQGDVIRDPTFPEMPTLKEVYELCYGREPQGVAWDAYQATLTSGFTIQKMMWVHGETPEEAVTALRQAAALAVADPEFSESAQNLIGDYNFFVGHEAQVTFSAASSLSPESISWLKVVTSR